MFACGPHSRIRSQRVKENQPVSVFLLPRVRRTDWVTETRVKSRRKAFRLNYHAGNIVSYLFFLRERLQERIKTLTLSHYRTPRAPQVLSDLHSRAKTSHSQMKFDTTVCKKNRETEATIILTCRELASAKGVCERQDCHKLAWLNG